MNEARKLTQADIARALGLSPAAVSNFKRRGMPVDSIDEARSWHRFHVRPRISMQPARLYEPELSALRTLWPVALAALHAGRLDVVRPALEQALRDVPEEARHLAMCEFEVMNALCAGFIEVLRPSAAEGESPTAPMTDSDAEAMGRMWYCVAAGEQFPLDWLSGESP